MSEAYTDEQIAILIDLYYRNHHRPMPFPAIAKAMGRPENCLGLEELLWKTLTGYSGNDPEGPRRAILVRSPYKYNHRAGWEWYQREDDALRGALAGEGQRRETPCDVRYISLVLARTCEETQRRWDKINGDPLGREGFGLGGKG